MIRRPATILALLTILNAFNYLDRYVVAAVLPRIETDLALNHSRSGFLATAFLLGYFLTSPIFGALERRYPRTLLIAVGIAIWSAATIASGFAHSFPSLVAARAVVGVGEASFVTLAPTIIDDVADRARRGLWLSIFYVAMPVGAALGYIVGGGLEHAYGWRAAFWVAGGPGLLLALSIFGIRDPDRGAQRDRPALLAQFADVLREPVYRSGLFGYCANTFAQGAFSFWAPHFLVTQHGLPLDVANYRFGMITVGTGIFATLVGGAWSDRWTAREVARIGRETTDPAARAAEEERAAIRVNMSICVIASMIAAPLAAACFLSSSASMFFGCVTACESALFLLNSPVMVVVLRTVRPDLRATAAALSVFAIHFLGDLWSPWIVGALADVVPARTAMMVLPLAIFVSALIWGREAGRTRQIERRH